jgi:hypothetical protein
LRPSLPGDAESLLVDHASAVLDLCRRNNLARERAARIHDDGALG